MKETLENGDVFQANFNGFYDKARAFFLKVYQYCVKLLPLEDLLLKNSQFVKSELRSTPSFDSVQCTIEYFHLINTKVIKNLPLLD